MLWRGEALSVRRPARGGHASGALLTLLLLLALAGAGVALPHLARAPGALQAQRAVSAGRLAPPLLAPHRPCSPTRLPVRLAPRLRARTAATVVAG
jgi:hypothetical protein